jgi:Flp pilus assembly pilin Flp
MRNRLRALLLNASAQTLSESAFIYGLIVVLGIIIFGVLGTAVAAFWDDLAARFVEVIGEVL